MNVIHPPHVRERLERRRLGFLRDMETMRFTVGEQQGGGYFAWRFDCDNLAIIYSPYPNSMRYWPAFCEVLRWEGKNPVADISFPVDEQASAPSWAGWHLGFYSFRVPNKFGWVVSRPRIQMAVDMEMRLEHSVRERYENLHSDASGWHSKLIWAPWRIVAKGILKGNPDFSGFCTEWLEPLGSIIEPENRISGWAKKW